MSGSLSARAERHMCCMLSISLVARIEKDCFDIFERDLQGADGVGGKPTTFVKIQSFQKPGQYTSIPTPEKETKSMKRSRKVVD
jgi:hypothetical protein